MLKPSINWRGTRLLDMLCLAFLVIVAGTTSAALFLKLGGVGLSVTNSLVSAAAAGGCIVAGLYRSATGGNLCGRTAWYLALSLTQIAALVFLVLCANALFANARTVDILGSVDFTIQFAWLQGKLLLATHLAIYVSARMQKD